MSLEAKNLKKIKWARLSVVSNLFLIIFKIAVWLVTGSISVLSEAIHSAIDMLAAITAFFSIKKSSTPADHSHPFGHGKFEDLSGLIESVLIILAGLFIIYESYPKFFNPHKIAFIEIAIAVMLFSAIINFFVARILYKVARETDSIALETDGAHLAADVYTCAGVLGGLIVIRITGLVILDPIISMGVALYIIWLGISLSYKSLKDLLDESLSPDEVAEIQKIISSHGSMIASFHKLATRKAGGTRMIDVHLQVHGNSSIREAHDKAHHIQSDIEEKFPNSRVMIHTEPCEENCSACNVAPCPDRKNKCKEIKNEK